MASLDRTLRRGLENTVKQARRVAEAGARKAVEQLAVQHHEPWSSMSAGQRQLRNRLRAHGRQLGDLRDDKRGTQSIDRLVGECAYEHWHRMLFARFLAENELLIEPGHGVAISLEDCRELARAQGQDWLELASSYAVRMLPQIFRADDPVLELSLPPESRSELEDLLKGLSREVFLADDSLGWVYQFWQAEQKDAVNKSEKKIGSEELPAVTQLFTEDYMVEFLLHNTLGAWWAGKALAANPDLVKNARGEDELRAACAVGDVRWTFLRFVQDEDGSWRPAAGTFLHWPAKTAELKVLDPCCGSGHFMVFALPILTAMRMAEEGLSARDACDAVLRDNLFGLELDQRCTQIAAFNLALAAWKSSGYHLLPPPQVACSGLSVGASKESWLRLAKGSPRTEAGLARLYNVFKLAPTLGSLLDPRSGDVEAALLESTFDELRPLLEQALESAQNDDEAYEIGVTAQGLLHAVRVLSSEYDLVATNVPYLARSKHDANLRQYAERVFPDSKQDIATLFLRRYLNAYQGGVFAAVTPHNWLFLTSYRKLRETIVKEYQLNLIARLGARAFETIGGEVVNVALCILSNAPTSHEHAFGALDASDAEGPLEKMAHIQVARSHSVTQEVQLKNPDARISFESLGDFELLSKRAGAYQGVSPADYPHFGRCFWETALTPECVRWQASVEQTCFYGGRFQILLKNEDFDQAVKDGKAYWRGNDSIGKSGVVVSAMGELPVTLSEGQPNDTNVAVVVPYKADDLPAIWSFCSSTEYSTSIRQIDQALKVTNASMVKVSFDLEYWQKIAAKEHPNGLPEPYSDDPTQWLFHGHPCGSVRWIDSAKRLKVGSLPHAEATVLQVAVARLLGYRWPAEHDTEMRLSAESRSLVARCTELNRFADEDGIVCLSPIHAEAPASQRVINLLACAYGNHWSAAKLNELLAASDCAGKTLEDWLRDKFFEQHSALFHHRPFIWHIWDGRRDGFNALVNYHRLAAPNGEGRRTLEKIIYTYLGDWITQQRRDQQAQVEGADARLAAALHLQEELKKILEGEPPYDLFVRWKPLHEQPIGWDPDINDGVRLNIRSFMTARPLSTKARNACILRATPKSIKWDKDRGKEPERTKEDYPWFWGWDEKMQDFAGGKTFDGNRWNDLHYSNAFKQAARQRRERGV